MDQQHFDESFECILKARLGYDFADPDESEYIGLNADMLDARIKGKARSYCGWYYDNTDWCTYENSGPNGDSTFIVNLDDNAFDGDYEVLMEDTLTIHNAFGKTIIFGVEVCMQHLLQYKSRRSNNYSLVLLL